MLDINITIQGVTPLLQHNVQLADPLNKYTKQLAEATAALKRDKTDEAVERKYLAEWRGGLYVDPVHGEIVIPSSWIGGSFYRGGVIYGKKGKAVQQSLILTEEFYPLLHDGKDIESMSTDANFRDVRPVRVGQSVVMRTRPRFQTWAVEATAMLDESALDLEVLRVIADKAGNQAGMGDYRPETGGPFGRYTVKITEAK